MSMKIKLIAIFLLLTMIIFQSPIITYASDGQKNDRYVIYNENNEKIMEKSAVEVGDSFITQDFEEYEIYKIEGNEAYARKLSDIIISRSKNLNNEMTLNSYSSKPTICLYMTHNDESYTPTDGYDSIYGAGGIHDVAKELKSELESNGYNVVLDETLHIPHNSSAYSRSGQTATKLFNTYSPDALFDIHRDGVSKSYYYTNQNGEDLSKIRIVVGKSNPNYSKNYEFAKELFVSGNTMYPWLFSDIYSGSGHYNQALKDSCLLFEMGTYLIEKEYVYNSIPYLVDAIKTVLPTSNSEDQIPPIEENPGASSDENSNSSSNELPDNTNDNDNIEIDNQNPENNENSTTDKNWIGAIIFASIIVIGLIVGGAFLYKKKKNEYQNKKDRN